MLSMAPRGARSNQYQRRDSAQDYIHTEFGRRHNGVEQILSEVYDENGHHQEFRQRTADGQESWIRQTSRSVMPSLSTFMQSIQGIQGMFSQATMGISNSSDNRITELSWEDLCKARCNHGHAHCPP